MNLGKLLIVIGLVLAAVGVVVLAAGKIPWLGRLPGDLRIERENFTLYVPLTSCLLISLFVSLLLWLFRR